MRVLIIEDEALAAKRLVDLVKSIEPTAEIAGKLESVRATVKWFGSNPPPHLIFMDVQLADGLCFEIFEQIKIDIPVIFTTAYNEYALKAFKVNSIDYLLKPIDKSALQQAIMKYKRFASAENHTQPMDAFLFNKVKEMLQHPYKTRFLVHIGEHIKAVSISDISFIYSSDKATLIRSVSGRDYALDGSIDQIASEMDPTKFFRVSRKYLVSIDYVSDIIAYSGTRLKLLMKGIENDEIIVSREKVGDFKKWLEGGK
jgi:DNA-binding LytR/AlgR family response regulator